jgi:4-hydroxybutyrate dehydrogenase
MTLITFVTRVHFADRVLEDALAEELSRLSILRPLVLAEAGSGDETERLWDALPVAPRRSGSSSIRGGGGRRPARGGGALRGVGMRRDHRLRRRANARPRSASRGSGAPVVTVPTGTESVGLGPLAVGFRAPRGAAGLHAVGHPLRRDAHAGRGPAATAAAGMDALVHCLEAYLSTAYNPPADGIALDGLRRAALNLERAVQNGTDLAARRELLAAALNGGLASQKGFGGIEAAARGLEGEAGARHGALHAALLPEVLAFNLPGHLRTLRRDPRGPRAGAGGGRGRGR